LATDRDKQTDGQTDGHHRCVKPQSRYRELRLNKRKPRVKHRRYPGLLIY